MEKIKNITTSELKELISKDARYLNYLHPDIQLNVLKNHSATLIKYIDDPSEELQLYAIDQLVDIKSIANLTENAKLKAIKKDSTVIRYFENPSDELMIATLDRNIYAIEYIKNPSLKAKLFYVENYDEEIYYNAYRVKDVPYINVLELAEKDKSNLLLMDLDETIQNNLYGVYGFSIIYYIRGVCPSVLVKALNDGYRDDILFDERKYSMVDFVIQHLSELNESAKEFILQSDCITDFLLNLLIEDKVVKKEIMKRKLKNR